MNDKINETILRVPCSVFERWITLNLVYAIRWIEIYQVDSVIRFATINIGMLGMQELFFCLGGGGGGHCGSNGILCFVEKRN